MDFLTRLRASQAAMRRQVHAKDLVDTTSVYVYTPLCYVSTQV